MTTPSGKRTRGMAENGSGTPTPPTPSSPHSPSSVLLLLFSPLTPWSSNLYYPAFWTHLPVSVVLAVDTRFHVNSRKLTLLFACVREAQRNEHSDTDGRTDGTDRQNPSTPSCMTCLTKGLSVVKELILIR